MRDERKPFFLSVDVLPPRPLPISSESPGILCKTGQAWHEAFSPSTARTAYGLTVAYDEATGDCLPVARAEQSENRGISG